jgi:hypothetical protein
MTLLLLAVTPVHAQLAAAVLPSSRVVQVGTLATAFATIVNAGNEVAVGCRIGPPPAIPSITFMYQTTDPLTNEVTGTPNSPVDIPAGERRRL